MMYLLLVVQQLIAASTHLIAKSVTGLMHPVSVVLMRGAFTVTFYGIWYLIRRRYLPRIDRKDWPLLLLLGFINLPLNQLCFIWGVKFTTAPNAALAYALTPAFVVVILALGLRKWPGWKRLLGVGIAITGAAMVIVGEGASASAEHTLGNLVVLSASASWALYTVLGRRIVMKYGAVYATALTFFIGFALFVPVWLLMPVNASLEPLINPAINTGIWFQLFYLGVITSGVGYGLWYYALTHMDTHRVAVFNNLQPVFTTVLALIIFGTQPTPMFLVGGVVALAGVVMTQLVE
jgi:drug/metabolite transporter (DMT)-like permease